jgi:hypothetical protein
MPKQQTPDQIASLVISGQMSSANLPEEVLTELVKREAQFAAEAMAIAEKCKHIRAVLMENLEIGTHPLAGRKVMISVPRTTDYAAIAETYAFDTNPHLYKTVLDTAALKEHFAPAELNKFKSPGARKLEIRS